MSGKHNKIVLFLSWCIKLYSHVEKPSTYTKQMVELNCDWLIMTADISLHPSLFQEGKLITGCTQHY